MTPLYDAQTCDGCGHLVCASCQPDAIGLCVDDETVHCDSCVRTCSACTDTMLEEAEADAAREDWTANRKVAEGLV